MPELKASVFSIDRGSRQPLTFDGPRDVIEFLDTEKDFWSWATINQIDTNNGNIRNLISEYDPDWIARIRAIAEQWRDHGSENERNEQKHQVENALRKKYGSRQRLCARDTEALAISAIANQDVNVAAVALATLHGVASIHDPAFLQYGNNLVGIAKGLAIASGINPDAAAEAADELNKVRQKFEEDANALRAAIDETKKDAIIAAQKIASDAGGQHEFFQSEFSNHQNNRQSIFEGFKTEYAALKKAFEVDMQLKGPVRYWKNKAKRHGEAKWISLGILVVYTVVAVLALMYVYDRAAAHIPGGTSDPISYPALFKAGAFALLISSVAFWIGRVILRIYLSNQHLQTDAQERMTMAMTFLALIRSEAVSGEELSIVLGALFRSASDGIVKDDTSPDTALATLFSNLVKGPKP